MLATLYSWGGGGGFLGENCGRNRPLPDRHARTRDLGSQQPQVLAAGDGWSIYDVVCTAGPKDPAFEEQHSRTSVAVVLSARFNTGPQPAAN